MLPELRATLAGMSQPLGLLGASVCLLALGVGCQRQERAPRGFVDALPGQPAGRGERTFRKAKWVQVLSIGHHPGDTTLLRPRLITARNGVIAVFDYGDRRVKVLSRSGGITWSFGQKGSGPGEFQGAYDLESAEDGTLWVLDPDLNRLTLIAPPGRLDTILHPTTSMIRSVAPGSREAIVLTRELDPFWIRIRRDGSTVAEGRFPIHSMDAIPAYTRQPMAAGDPAGWAAVFPYGDLLLAYDHDSLTCTGRLMKSHGFPTAAQRNVPFTVAAIAILDSVVVVLVDGGGDDRLELLDLYSRKSCRYLESVRLPRKFSALAIDEALFVFQYEDPTPRILGLRLEFLDRAE